jgi:uncharacterized damage-inducible protein DinB
LSWRSARRISLIRLISKGLFVYFANGWEWHTLLKWLHYNWQVRDNYFELCEQIPDEELLRNRMGGAGSILYTFFHILDVEYSWIRGMQGKPDISVQFVHYKSLREIQELSDSWKMDIQQLLQGWVIDHETELVVVPWIKGSYSKGEILRHVIAHEIHHMGQVSIWVRELGFKPISASVIGREL